MDNKEEIKQFCETLCKIWTDNVSDLDFGMLMSIVIAKAKEKGRDVHFMTNSEILELFQEFDHWGPPKS